MEEKNNEPVQICINVRKGRPKAVEVIAEINAAKLAADLYEEFVTIICEYCKRSFPRKKALQTHLRTHTGDSPYVCTYPFCERSFKQSGQLKMHLKTHTHEKDYACPVEGCISRFAHPNRHCGEHPDKKLRRDNKGEVQYNENHTIAEREWLDNYKRTKGKPVKRKRTASQLPRSTIPEQSPVNPSVSPRQCGILCDTENGQNTSNNLWPEYDCQKKNTSAKRRKTLNISKVESPGSSSSMSSPARSEDFSSDTLNKPHSSRRLLTEMSCFLDLIPEKCVYYDQYIRNGVHVRLNDESIHNGVHVQQNSYGKNIYASEMKRSETLNHQKTEPTVTFDESSANSLHDQHTVLNSEPKPIRTSVIQSSHQSRNNQIQDIDAEMLNAAKTLILLGRNFIHEQN